VTYKIPFIFIFLYNNISALVLIANITNFIEERFFPRFNEWRYTSALSCSEMLTALLNKQIPKQQFASL
jgi:hypothetical protein